MPSTRDDAAIIVALSREIEEHTTSRTRLAKRRRAVMLRFYERLRAASGPLGSHQAGSAHAKIAALIGKSPQFVNEQLSKARTERKAP
jgi:hypothetical protein